MQEALKLAKEAANKGDVPVGALVVDDSGTIIGIGANLREQDNDPTAPYFSSNEPKTNLLILLCAIAPAHIPHGSSVTTIVKSSNR